MMRNETAETNVNKHAAKNYSNILMENENFPFFAFNLSNFNC